MKCHWKILYWKWVNRGASPISWLILVELLQIFIHLGCWLWIVTESLIYVEVCSSPIFSRMFVVKFMRVFVCVFFVCLLFVCIYWDDHMIFVFKFTYMIYCICWLRFVEPLLHLWDKVSLIVVDDLYSVFYFHWGFYIYFIRNTGL